MVMHVRDCSDTRVAIPFQIADEEAPEGWNRSRTWVLTRGPDGAITLKHEHRHEDGTLDAVTNYGGTTAEAGTATSAAIPGGRRKHRHLHTRRPRRLADQCVAGGGNRRWQRTSAYFAYQLTRKNDETRLFRVRFDADEAVAVPGAAWGSEQ